MELPILMPKHRLHPITHLMMNNMMGGDVLLALQEEAKLGACRNRDQGLQR